ncbi:MAG: FAD-dependent oxidoreductase [Kofleriaceae bacterium]
MRQTRATTRRATLGKVGGMSAREILDRFQPIGGLPVFVIGVTERAVTVASQQRRAIQLVDAMLRDGVIGAGSRLAVVGGGAAGLTTAVRAARAGCRVLLLEKANEMLSTFRGNHSRLLHPNLYSWPSRDWQNEDANLPVLSWKADTAGAVAHALDEQFRRERQRTSVIDVRTSVEVKWPPTVRGLLVRISWIESSEIQIADVNAVVLAVGFGREARTRRDSLFPGYWDNDSLDESKGKQSVLIQGAGDGGMTDALRIRLSSFDQATTFSRLLDRKEGVALESTIREIERLEDDVVMDKRYRELTTAWLDTAIRELGLRPHEVTLVDIRPTFGRGRFPLNKLLVSRLLRMNELRVVQVPPEPALVVPDPDDHGVSVDLNGTVEHFDRVLFRLPSKRAIDAFGPDVVDGCGVMVKSGQDFGASYVEPDGPTGSSLTALSAALGGSERLADLVATLLLYLRFVPFDVNSLRSDEIDWLTDEVMDQLAPLVAVVSNRAPKVVAVIQEWLLQRASHGARAVRAAAECIDELYGARIARSLRGDPLEHCRIEILPNQLMPRGARVDGRPDGGLSWLHLAPDQSCTVVLEWTNRKWREPLRVGGGRVFKSEDDLKLTEVASDRFFGVTAVDGSSHSRSLAELAERVAAADLDFVVLGEFSLLDASDWARTVARRANVQVFAGIGHVREENRQRHSRLAVFGGSYHQWSKSSASRYLRNKIEWTEDIHPGERKLVIALSSDGTSSVILGGEDLVELAPTTLAQSSALAVLITGGADLGIVAPMVHRETQVEVVFVGITEVIRHGSSQMIEYVDL